MRKKTYICPVCGYDNLDVEPYTDTTPFNSTTMDSIAYGIEYGSFEICPCCGFEYGYDDIAKIDEYRKKWIKSGANWFSTKTKPINWNLEKQLKNLNKLIDIKGIIK